MLSDANWDQLTEEDMYELMNFLALYEISHSRPVYGELRSECDKLVHCDDSGWLKNLDSDLNKELQSRIFKFFHPDYSFSYILKEPFNTTKDILDFQMFQMDSVKWWFTIYGYEFDNALFKHYYRQFCSEFVLRV